MPKVNVREAAVAGLFYSSNMKDLIKEVDDLLTIPDERIKTEEELRAIIVPHAGYVYSGEVASHGFVQIDGQARYKRIIIIGSSHRIRFDAVSVGNVSAYKTPIGEVAVDLQLANNLIKTNSMVKYIPEAHKDEHTLEVQLPFLQRRLKQPFKILPLIIGTSDIDKIKRVAHALQPYFNNDNLFVISTDFSHYPNYEDAVVQDNLTAEMIMNNNPAELLNFLEKQKSSDVPDLITCLCGWSSVLLLQYLTQNNSHIQYHHLLYQNSGDKLMKNHDRVVGYHSFAVCEKKIFNFSEQARKQLLLLAHSGLKDFLGVNGDVDLNLEQELDQKFGAFVSVYVNGQLRGCMGSFRTDEPLKTLVKTLVVDSAISDNRFDAVTLDELDDVRLEISVLGPLKPIADINEIEIGRHGIYIRKGLKKGTLLPSVAVRNGWNAEEFVRCCSERKAHIGADGWREADLFVYEALVISDV